MISKRDIAATIITYNPDIEELSVNIDAIVYQVNAVIIVDNGSVNIHEIMKFNSIYTNVTILPMYKNTGIAAALNHAFERAKEMKYKWLLTLDDDTLCSVDFILELSKYAQENIGVVCPRVNYSLGRINNIYIDKIEDVDACMTSGSLTNISAWEIIGKYDEWMFIDYVDNDFCKRLKLARYKIIRVNTVSMKHDLGYIKYLKIFNQKYGVICHAPLRHYYHTRNVIYYIMKYRGTINIPKEIIKLFYVELPSIITGDERKKSFRFFMKGIVDGINRSAGSSK